MLPAFVDGAPLAEVAGIAAAIQGQVAPAAPLLVYLRPTDIRAAVERVHRVRGEPWSSWNIASVTSYPWSRARRLSGLAAVVELYRAWEPVVDRMYEEYPFGKLMVLDPQRDWSGAMAKILAAVRG